MTMTLVKIWGRQASQPDSHIGTRVAALEVTEHPLFTQELGYMPLLCKPALDDIELNLMEPASTRFIPYSCTIHLECAVL